MHLLSTAGTFQGRKSACALPLKGLHIEQIILHYANSISLLRVFLTFSVPFFWLPFTSSFSLSDLALCYTSCPPLTIFCLFLPVALYAISAVYFAGVMVRLMLTLTPVVCMLSAVAFSSVFEHYMGDDTKREKPPAEDSSDEDDKRNSGNLYDKVRQNSRWEIWKSLCWLLTFAAPFAQRFVFMGCLSTSLLTFPPVLHNIVCKLQLWFSCSHLILLP